MKEKRRGRDKPRNKLLTIKNKLKGHRAGSVGGACDS